MALENAIGAVISVAVLAVAWGAAVGLEIYAASQLWRVLERQGRWDGATKRSLVAFVGVLVLVQTVLVVPPAVASLPAHRLSRFGGSWLVLMSNSFAPFFLVLGPFLVLQVCAKRVGWSSQGRLLANAPLALKLLWVPGLLLVVARVFYWAWVCSGG